MEPIELAKWLIRSEVLRGDEISHIRGTQAYSGGPGYSVSIGGAMYSVRSHERMDLAHGKGYKAFARACQVECSVPTSKILVAKAKNKIVNQVYSLAEIYRMVEREQVQPTLF